jgi:hypothetical protein
MTAIQFLEALVAAIRAIPILDSWFVQLLSIYITSATEKTRTEIVDVAALSAKATTDGDRYEAAKKWQDALSRDRIGS